MMPASVANPTPSSANTQGVWLEVRLGTAAPVEYPLGPVPFLIGGASGCDLRLPGSQLPPVVCQIHDQGGTLSLRRHDPAFPILVNCRPVSEMAEIGLDSGDRLAIGPADLRVSRSPGHLRPRFVPLGPPPPPSPAVIMMPPPPPTDVDEEEAETEPAPYATAALAAERAELERLAAELHRQTTDLENDRVAWYRRREEIEAESRAAQAREQALTQRATEVDRLQKELTELQHNLAQQYQERRQQLGEMQSLVQGATEELNQRRQHFDDEIARREQQLREREAAVEQRVATVLAGRAREIESAYQDRLDTLDAENRRLRMELQARPEIGDLAEREEKLRAEQQRHAEDLVRLERRSAAIEDRERIVERRAAEIDRRHEQLTRDTRELEEHVGLVDAEQERVNAENARLEKIRGDLEVQSARLAERAAQLESQQAMLAVIRARLDRQQEESRQSALLLAADRGRQDEAQRDLDERLREAERLRVELSVTQEGQAEQQKLIEERSSLLEATLEELRQQKAAIAAEQERLTNREAELDARSAEIAEQTAILKARVSQVMDLQERLEADRSAVREREVTLTDADSARQTFQEQLRRRADELSTRARQFDDMARQLAEDRAALEHERQALAQERDALLRQAAEREGLLATQHGEFERRLAGLAEREASIERQVARVREVGRTVAATKKALAQEREQTAAERTRADQERQAAILELERLRRQAPILEDQVGQSMERLGVARETLRGQLAELHAFAGDSRREIDALRAELRADADRLHAREQALEAARAEHRLAVAAFRQQLVEWQARVQDLKQAMSRDESRLEARQTEVSAAAEKTDAVTRDLARQAEELRQERQEVAARRAEVEQHLADMREWYRKKLRELALSRSVPNDTPGVLSLPEGWSAPVDDELDPGDRQLGELLRTLDLVDPGTLSALWADAQRQRRTLRQVLLASGAITLYQLALIEAGNLDSLMLGRLRVMDRLKVTAKESVYRVFDPTRADSPSRGICILRHLAESEMDDAVRPNEFRERFTLAGAIREPGVAATFEVLEIAGRPAVLQEWVSGLPGSEWSAEAAAPGVWLRLLAETATALDAAHQLGLTHGRLTSETILFTEEGRIKLIGVGDPPWLAAALPEDVSPEADLRALGQVALAWSQIGGTTPKRRGARARTFPDSLLAVVRRLEADPETPMADTMAEAIPYRSVHELVLDLQRLQAAFPCPADLWGRLVAHVVENIDPVTVTARRSA